VLCRPCCWDQDARLVKKKREDEANKEEKENDNHRRNAQIRRDKNFKNGVYACADKYSTNITS